MEALQVRLRQLGANGTLLALICVSILMGVLVGYRITLTPYSLVRFLVLVNVMLIGYIVIIRNIYAGMLIYLYSLVFLNYYWRIVIPGKWPDLDVPRLIFVFVWIIFLLEILLERRRLLPNGAIGTTMLLVIGAFVLSMLTMALWPTRQLLNGYVIPYAMYTIAKNTFTDRRTVDRFIFWFAVPLVMYFPLTAIFEHYRVMVLVFPRYIGESMGGKFGIDWGGRAMGTFIQPAATGYAMTAIYVLAMYVLAKRAGAFSRICSVLITILIPIGIFFTYTRSVYAGFLVALVTMLVFSKRQRLPALILIVAMCLAVIGNWSNVTTSDRTAGGIATRDTAEARLVLANASMRMFVDHPLFGVGFTRFIENSGPYVSQVRSTFLGYKEAWLAAGSNQHNQFLSVLTEIGLSGFVPFVLLYYFVFRMLARARKIRADAYDYEFVIAVIAIMLAYLTETLFIEPRFYEFMNTLPYMMAGIVAGGYQRATMKRAMAMARGAST